MPGSRHIIIADEEGALPYSKGLMASSIMATGLAPERAFAVAERIEEHLRARSVPAVTRDELFATAEQMLEEAEGHEYADAYAKWHVVKRLEQPLVILIGGATGVGKSTVATQLGARLGINRVIPTDAIREVMRAMLEEELAPALHTSSFDADRLVHQPLPRRADPLLVGFREQAVMIAVGIRALVRRAVREGTPLVVEGVHVVPGLIDPAEFQEKAVVVPLLIMVENEELHRSHFQSRGQESHSRPVERYLEHFARIRKIQEHLVSLAREHAMPVVPSYDLDSTLSRILELAVSAGVRAIPSDQQIGTSTSVQGSNA